MWFAFPQGYDRITVERQEFVPEVTDEEGRKYFRAPNHFAPQILAFKGFVHVENPPEGSPADLPLPDPLRDGAISQLTREKEGLQRELANARTDLGVANARIAALVNENGQYKDTVQKQIARIGELEEQLEESVSPPAPLPAKKA